MKAIHNYCAVYDLFYFVVKDLYKNTPDSYRGLNRNAVKIGVAKAIHNKRTELERSENVVKDLYKNTI